MTELVALTVQGEIAIVTLNHPQKNNALSADIREQLLSHLTTCENDKTIKIILLNANGKHFCAGADLNEMLAMSHSSFEINLKNAKSLAHFFYRFYHCKKPTICCTQGKTMGGGIGLIAACDITIAVKTAEFCFPEVKLGMTPATIAPFVSHRIGFSRAQSLMLTAELFNAQRAHEINLIDYLCDNEPFDFAFLLAEKMLRNNLVGMQATKQWLRQLHPIHENQLDQAAQLLAEIRGTAEVRELLINALNPQKRARNEQRE